MRGAESKQIVINKILETFKDSFIYNNGKEIRVPMEENGERVEIKVALTCAKTNVGGDGASVESGGQASAFTETPAVTDLTTDEKENIQKIMDRLGI
jgi:hypothetical protein